MRALITGVTGQDGQYLARFLLDKNYEVFGMVRGQNNPKIAGLNPQIKVLDGDLTDSPSLVDALYKSNPHEIYNLGAFTHVGKSFGQPELVANVTGLGCLRLLEAIGQVCPEAKFYQASTSELFGDVRESPQTEQTPFYPRSPYGTAKAFAHHTTVNYRESYGTHASCGILFNHESPIRGYEFVTRKVTQGVARIQLGVQDTIKLGNIHSQRDWGFAGDYVEAMWLMLQQKTPSDYIIATGKTHSIEDLLIEAFSAIDLAHEWPKYVEYDKSLLRPAEVSQLCGNYTKAAENLDWHPQVTFKELIKMMVEHDLMIEKRKMDGTLSCY